MRRLAAVLTMTAAMLLAAGTAYAQPAPVGPISYGPRVTERLWVYPGETTGLPTVVMVPGGWWEKNEGGEPPYKSEQIELQPVATMVAINYPVAAELAHPFPEEDEAVEAATKWAIAHAAEYGGNPSNIEFYGASAGGQLVSMVTDRMNAEAPGTIKATAELSAPGMDFVSFVSELEHGETALAGVTPTKTVLECGRTLATCTEEQELRWSPVDHLECPGAAWLLAYGQEADIVDPAQQIGAYERLTGAGCEAQLQPEPKGHATGYFTQIKPVLKAFIAAH